MGFLIPAAILAAKGISALEKKKAQSKQNDSQRNATIASLTLRQKQSEDARIARLKLGADMLGRVPKTTAGGGVNTNVGIDPELLKQLEIARTYDFGSTVPDGNAGSTDAFLSGLFGSAGDALAGVKGGGAQGTPTPTSMLYNRTAAGVQLPGGGPQTAPIYPVGDAASGGLGNVSWEDLFKQRGGGE